MLTLKPCFCKKILTISWHSIPILPYHIFVPVVNLFDFATKTVVCWTQKGDFLMIYKNGQLELKLNKRDGIHYLSLKQMVELFKDKNFPQKEKIVYIDNEDVKFNFVVPDFAIEELKRAAPELRNERYFVCYVLDRYIVVHVEVNEQSITFTGHMLNANLKISSGYNLDFIKKYSEHGKSEEGKKFIQWVERLGLLDSNDNYPLTEKIKELKEVVKPE